MLAAVTRSPGEMVIEDVSGPRRRARPGHVIVRPEAVGICGSDFHLFSGDLGALSGSRDFYPRVQGHEVSAIIEDPGDSADGTGSANATDGSASTVRAGDRVAIWPLLPCGHCYPCRQDRPNVCVEFRLVGVHLDGGLQERLEVPAGLVFGVGDLDPDSTCFIEPASVAVHALNRARLRPGEQVVVFGSGPIGLATLVAAVHRGARVLCADPLQTRRDLAKRLGAEVVAGTGAVAGAEVVAGAGAVVGAGTETAQEELIREWTGGEGPPLVVETSGEASVLPQAMDAVAQAGRIVVVGMSSDRASLRPGAFPEKEIDVIGSSCATAADFRDAIRLVAANRTAVATLFSHHFPLARAAEAIEFAMSRPPDAVKIVVTVN